MIGLRPRSRLVAAMLVAIALANSGCASRMTSDYLDEYRIRGRLAEANGNGVSDVDVLFTDTGLDQWAAPNQFVIARTMADGGFDVTFRYSWGREKSHESPGTFEVAFRKGSRVLAAREYRRSQLVREDGTLIVEASVTLR